MSANIAHVPGIVRHNVIQLSAVEVIKPRMRNTRPDKLLQTSDIIGSDSIENIREVVLSYTDVLVWFKNDTSKLRCTWQADRTAHSLFCVARAAVCNKSVLVGILLDGERAGGTVWVPKVSVYYSDESRAQHIPGRCLPFTQRYLGVPFDVVAILENRMVPAFQRRL